MKKTLTFTVSIDAPRAKVWDTLQSDAGYRDWTSAFAEGSHFEGSWEQGQKILFLAPNGDGMVAEVAENRRHEFISLRHLGERTGGVDDTTSEKVRAWAPAYENYRFRDVPGGTEVTASLETLPEWEGFMNEAFPKALARLKALCEKS